MKKVVVKKVVARKVATKNILFNDVKSLIDNARHIVIRNVNSVMLITNFEIGRMIVEDKQAGNIRADYAKKTLEKLSTLLTKEFGKGYSTDNLELMRKFYLTYKTHKKSIQQFGANSKKISETSSRKLEFPFKLTWSHYVQLVKIENNGERSFYEIETIANNWTIKELQRQYNTGLYERLLINKGKKTAKQLATKGQVVESFDDVLKSSYIFEFLDLKAEHIYSETDLETAIINKLGHFILELGKGFLFEGRQKRFSFEGDSFYVDLVFYNRLLKCFVLFDLKIGKLAHQDIGQMQMYVNYYDRYVKTETENPTIGIVLCKQENKTVVEITLPKDNKQIFAKEYKSVLPSKAELIKQLE